MKSYKKMFIFLVMATLARVLLCYETASTKIGLEQAIEQQLNQEQLRRVNSVNPPFDQSFSQHLKRKKRYLEFPEGSSFQLVYDLIVGVVDFTNYLILGVTVALAWELPSKPPSEIFDDISERLKDGTLGTSRNDTTNNIKYTDSKHYAAAMPAIKYKYSLQPIFRPPMHYKYYSPQNPMGFFKNPITEHSPNLNKYTQNKKHHLLYTTKQAHPFSQWAHTKKSPKLGIKGTQYPWWNLPERLKNSFDIQPNIRRFDKNINLSRVHSYKKVLHGSTGRSAHRIYPVFGKRSISLEQTQNYNQSFARQRYRRSGIFTEHPSKLDRIHIEYHRRTRHDLYQRIETYLNGRGFHGHHCVLRALCETGQKSNELQPGSFVGELMRTIFTMPEPLDVTADRYKHIGNQELRYDEANAHTQDCAIRYSHCKDSLWSSYFVL